MVYFVSNNSDGCWYYRCYLPMMYNGFQGDKTSLKGERLPGNMSSQLALKADTVVFQRADSRDRLETAAMLKKLGKKIVFENDDTYKDNDPMKFERFNGTLEEKITAIDDFIKIADMVTTTTEFLADEYRKLNKNVVVLKNLIDPHEMSESHKKANQSLTDDTWMKVYTSVERVNSTYLIREYPSTMLKQYTFLTRSSSSI